MLIIPPERKPFYIPEKNCWGCRTNKGNIFIFDEIDLPLVVGRRWYEHSKKKPYAATNIKINGKYRTTFLHRQISGATGTQVTDHANCNMQDNGRSNLRIATATENVANRKKIGIRSKYKGVFPNKKRWMATICHQYLGLFVTEEAAARAYDNAARHHFGEYARVNFPREGEQSAHPYQTSGIAVKTSKSSWSGSTPTSPVPVKEEALTQVPAVGLAVV